MSFTITSLNTPYGMTMFVTMQHAGETIALFLDETNPHAAIYAAKLQGANRIIEAVSVQPVSAIMEPGDIFVPDGLVDLTSGRESTFFAERGYGFIGQDPVWCPDLRAALINAGRSITERTFARGVLAVGEEATEPAEAVGWQAQGLARTGTPATYLAKELELCYAVVGIVGGAASERGNALIAALGKHLPQERTCACATSMQGVRDRGLIGDDWRTWIGDRNGSNPS